MIVKMSSFLISRTYVYYDAHLLDTFFDGGGDINAGLIACAVVARWCSTYSFTQPIADARDVSRESKAAKQDFL